MTCNDDVIHQLDEATFRLYQMQHLGAFISDLCADEAVGSQAGVRFESLQVVFGMIEDELKKSRDQLGAAGVLLAQRRRA